MRTNTQSKGRVLVALLALASPACETGDETRAQPVKPSTDLAAAGSEIGRAAPDTRAPTPTDPTLDPPAARLEKQPAEDAARRIEDETNTIEVFEAAAPATVFVTQKQLVRDRWSRNAMSIPAGSGTGFIWDDRGHVVTNFHVIAKGQSFEVAMHDGSTHEARLVGGDPNKDIAVLRIHPPPAALSPVRLPPEDSSLVVGQKTLAIGNPFGLDHTLTTGVVSALGRDVMGYGGVTIRDMIQTDASINPGNSGGPLLDSAGRLIGMNTMIYSRSGGSAGIGFAVPVSSIRRVVPQLIAHGRTTRAGLGIERVPDHIARQNGIEGIVIRAVVPRGPAAAAGLRGLQQRRFGTALGDVIVGVEGEAIRNFDDLYNALDGRNPGDEVVVRVRRDDSVREVRLRLTQL
jgi:S1-C subfamily serine protease